MPTAGEMKAAAACSKDDFQRAASRAASARSMKTVAIVEPDGDDRASNAPSSASMKRLQSGKSMKGGMKKLATYTREAGDDDRKKSMTSRSFADRIQKEAQARAQQQVKDMAIGILDRMTGELDTLEDHLQSKNTMTLADMQLLDDAMDGEKALRVKWHAHVKQARADMERDAVITSLADRSDAYKAVMGRLLSMNRSPPLDYLLTEFDEEEEDGRRHGALENLMQLFGGLTSIVHSTLDAPRRIGLTAIGVEDGPNEKLSEWRELALMAEKIGRELEVFTGYSAQHMNRAAHAVDANGLMPGGVREAKAALNAMLKALNKSVASLREVDRVWGDDETKAELLRDWTSQMKSDVGGVKKIQRLEAAVSSLEGDLEESDANNKKLEKKIADMTRENEHKMLEYDAMLEMLTTERDRTMEANEQLGNQVEDLTSDLELAKQKANWVDTLEREKTRLVTIRDQLERKVKDLQTDIADHQASSKKMKEEFAEMLQEIKLAREAKAEHEQTAATLVEVTAELQKAKATIEDLEATLERHKAGVELDIREAEARAVAASEELSAQLRNDLQKMSNEVNEYKAKWKSSSSQVKKLEEQLEQERTAPGSSTPEPAMPEGAVTQDSSVHEVVAFLEEYQMAALENPLQRADFVAAFDETMSTKLRTALADVFLEKHPELLPAPAPAPVPALDMQAVTGAREPAEKAESSRPQVSCRDDGSALSSHRTIQGDASEQEKILTARPDTEDQATMTDGTNIKSSEQQTDVKTFADCEVGPEAVTLLDAELNTLVSHPPSMQLVETGVQTLPAAEEHAVTVDSGTYTSKTVNPSLHVSRSSTVNGDVIDSILSEVRDALQAEHEAEQLRAKLASVEEDRASANQEAEELRAELATMRQVVKGGRKALLEKEAVAGTAALRNKVLQRKQEGMEGLAAQVEALSWELREATDDAARARARVGDLQEEVVARMESGKALAEENCALEERVKELEELFRSGVEENLALEAVVAAKTAELEDAMDKLRVGVRAGKGAAEAVQLHINIVEAAADAAANWPTVKELVRVNPFLQEVVELHPYLHRTVTIGKSQRARGSMAAAASAAQSTADGDTTAADADDDGASHGGLPVDGSGAPGRARSRGGGSGLPGAAAGDMAAHAGAAPSPGQVPPAAGGAAAGGAEAARGVAADGSPPRHAGPAGEVSASGAAPAGAGPAASAVGALPAGNAVAGAPGARGAPAARAGAAAQAVPGAAGSADGMVDESGEIWPDYEAVKDEHEAYQHEHRQLAPGAPPRGATANDEASGHEPQPQQGPGALARAATAGTATAAAPPMGAGHQSGAARNLSMPHPRGPHGAARADSFLAAGMPHGSPLPSRGQILAEVGEWWESPTPPMSMLDRVASHLGSFGSAQHRPHAEMFGASGPGEILVEVECQTEEGIGGEEAGCQTEFAIVDVEVAMALMEAPLARAEALLEHLQQRLDLLGEAGAAAEELLADNLERSIAADHLGAEMGAVSHALAESVTGVLRDTGAVLKLFPPMAVEPSWQSVRRHLSAATVLKPSPLRQGLDRLKWGSVPVGAAREALPDLQLPPGAPLDEGGTFKLAGGAADPAVLAAQSAGVRASYPQPAGAGDGAPMPHTGAGDVASSVGYSQEGEATLLGSFPMYTGDNSQEVKAKLKQSVDLLTEVATSGQLGSLQPRVHQELEGLIRSYSNLLERVESFEKQGNGGKARQRTPEAAEDLRRIQHDTHQANQRLTQLGRYKSFRNAVNDKIAEWEAQMCKVAGMSPEMQGRYETAHRKALLRMAEFLVSRFRKAEKLLASAVYVKPTAPRNAGVASMLAAPADPWEDTISLYQRVPTPPTHHDKLNYSGPHTQARFGLTEDWRTRKAANPPMKRGHGIASPERTPRGDSDNLMVGEVREGWHSRLTDTGTPRATQSARKGEGSPPKERVKLPAVKSARKASKAERAQESHGAYQVYVRKAPKLGIMGATK